MAHASSLPAYVKFAIFMIRRDVAEYKLNPSASPTRTLDGILTILDAVDAVAVGADPVSRAMADPADPTPAVIDPDRPF